MPQKLQGIASGRGYPLKYPSEGSEFVIALLLAVVALDLAGVVREGIVILDSRNLYVPEQDNRSNHPSNIEVKLGC